MSTANIHINLMLFSLFLMATIFVIDLQLPLGVAGGVPYVIVMLVSLWFKNKSYVIGLAILCTALTLIGFYLSPAGGELWKVAANRALAIFAILATATLVVKWDSSQKRVLRIQHEAEKEKVKAKEEIYEATMHGALHVTNNLLNQLQLVKLEMEGHKGFDKEILKLLDGMVLEAGGLLDKLASVEEIEADKIKQSVYPE